MGDPRAAGDGSGGRKLLDGRGGLLIILWWSIMFAIAIVAMVAWEAI